MMIYIMAKYFANLKKKKNISVAALSRLTGLHRTVIYRAFENQSCKSYRLLIRLALEHPEMFLMTKELDRELSSIESGK